MEIAIILASLLANLVTRYAKPGEKLNNPTFIIQRKKFVRLLNAVVGLVMLSVTAWLLGEPLNMETAAGFIETIIAVAITYAASQGMYLTRKRTEGPIEVSDHAHETR